LSQAQEILWEVRVIKFKLARSEILTVVLLIPQVVWNSYCVDCKQLLTFKRIIVPSTAGSNSQRLFDPVSVRCQTNIGCGHEDIKEAFSTETSHRYTVKSHKHSCLATINISKLKQISRLHANNGTKTPHI